MLPGRRVRTVPRICTAASARSTGCVRSIRCSGIALLVLVILFAHATPSAEALTIRQCTPAVPSAANGDLRVEFDRRTIAFTGRTTRVDAEPLRTALIGVVDERGELNRRTVCVTLRTVPGEATYVGESIPAAVEVLSEISGNSRFSAMWGGGGLTVVGWMHSADLSRLKNLASSSFPVDVRAVGVLEELPAKVWLRVERVTISTSIVAQIEQFHPKAGVITLSTNSTVRLVACPGGWRGKTLPAVWKSAGCVNFDSASPAVLPNPGNDFTHLSVAIRPLRGTASAIDLDLRYTAVDPAYECYVGGIANNCTLFPPRLAN